MIRPMYELDNDLDEKITIPLMDESKLNEACSWCETNIGSVEVEWDYWGPSTGQFDAVYTRFEFYNPHRAAQFKLMGF